MLQAFRRAALLCLAQGALTIAACSSSESLPPLSEAARSTNQAQSNSHVQPPALSERVIITLVRNSMLARECRLSVILASAPAVARLGCQYGTGLVEPSPLLTAEETLVAVEGTRLLALARAADLFGGGHVGVGGGSNDAPFETLHVSGERNVSAILVVSGNPMFESEGPRRDLLEALLTIWGRLRAQGRTGPG
jgi:hypothetical protein